MEGVGSHPLYVNVEMENGNTATNWIDSLQAAFPGTARYYREQQLLRFVKQGCESGFVFLGRWIRIRIIMNIWIRIIVNSWIRILTRIRNKVKFHEIK